MAARRVMRSCPHMRMSKMLLGPASRVAMWFFAETCNVTAFASGAHRKSAGAILCALLVSLM